MHWSPQQDQALRDVDKFMRDPERQVYYLAGYAGTGKTTLAKHFAEGVDGTVLFGAYTGKASYVLRQKGCPGATTIHSLIYTTKEKGRARLRELEIELTALRANLAAEGSLEEGGWSPEQIEAHPKVSALRRLIEQEREALSQPMFMLNPESIVRDASLIVIDECSMVDGRMGEDLLSFGVKVLVLGDPAQLPPVMGGGFFTERTPDMQLTEVHRQARDNPIIELATMTREGRAIPLGSYGSSRVIERERIGARGALEADQILVGRNATRHASNRRVRELKGIESQLPIIGDRLVCLRNNHERGLLNGAIWNVADVGDVLGETMLLSVDSDESNLPEPLALEVHTAHFVGREDKLGWWERGDAEEFDYGYALTVHKAQGSQFNKVLLFDESGVFRADKWRWLYTGITRAAESVDIARM